MEMTTGESGCNGTQEETKQNISCSDQAQSFLDQEGASLHPALDPENEERYRLPHTGDAAPFQNEITELYKDEFKLVLKVYQKSQADSKVGTLEIVDERGWAEVIKYAEDAEEKYRTEGDQNIKKLGRVLTDMSASAPSDDRMIPDDAYLGVLIGGLRVVFESIACIGQEREDALNAVLRIPLVIIKADNYCINFGRDAIVLAMAEKVYVAALGALQGIIEWLSSASSSMKSVSTALSSKLYAKSLEDKLAILHYALDLLETHVSGAQDKLLTAMGAGAETNKSAPEPFQGDLSNTMTTEAGRTLAGAESLSKAQTQHHNDMSSSAYAGFEGIGGTEHGFFDTHGQYQYELTQRLNKISRDAIEEMKKVLADTNSHAKWMKQREYDIKKLNERVEEMEKAARALSPEELMEILGIGRDQSHFDLHKVVTAVADSLDATMALRLTQHAKFQAWQNDDNPSAFFVEARMSSVSHRYLSAVTLASGYFIQSLQDYAQVTSIHFFCGHHTGPMDELQGPRGMIKSLICQMLQLFPLQIDFISPRLRQQLEVLNFWALCDCLGRIIRHLPATTILFCIIDSINFFETQFWAEDTMLALQTLHNLVEDFEIKAALRVLVTSSSRTHRVGEMFTPDQRLSVQGEEGIGRAFPQRGKWLKRLAEFRNVC